ncbi:FAD-dependent oxidoreductase [Solirhodobacter olei]|uniref:FAD-dependent oxidoreductase n=1 Tax=Solirhodobacter olei TaxID=2493082 RepID=UPI0019D4CA6F
MAWEADVVIIGTGAAGIGAMRGLAGSGMSVIVLEALPRLGGRAWTRQAAGVALDLGCGYLHSAERNPWVSIAEAAGIEIDRTPPRLEQAAREFRRSCRRACCSTPSLRALDCPHSRPRAGQ